MLNIFNTIIEMNIKAAIVILLILMVRLFLKNAPKKFSYMLWAVAAFRLCVPYSFKTIFSVFNFGGKETISEQITHSVEKIPTYVPGVSFEAPIVNSSAVNTPAVNITQTSGGEIVNTVTENSIDWGVLLTQIILVLWILGFAAMFIYGIITYVKTHRRMQNRILSRDNIYFSDKIDTPFSMGFIKPKIYLPFGLTDEEQECIIAHEECHIKRFDHIIKLFSYLLLCVHWFNPMCWVAFNRMTYDMETSCDEMVFASGITEEKKKQYSHTLISVGTKKRFPAPAPINFDGISNTKSRIKNILKLRKTKVWIRIICYVLCAVVLFACAADVNENITDSQIDADSAQSEIDSAQSESKDMQDTTVNPTDLITNASELVVNAINGNIKITTEEGERVYLKNISLGLPTTKFTGYTFLDLDSDGIAEGILQLYNYYGYIILREYNNEVYSYFMWYRGFHLKNDSTYLSSGGASNNRICRIEFDESAIREVVLAVWLEIYESNEIIGTYEIDGNAVSAEEVHTYFDQWCEKENVSFVPFEQNSDITNAEDIFEIGIATEEMLADDSNIHFVDESAAYNNYDIYIRPNYNLTDFKFIELDESEDLKIGRTLYEIGDFSEGDTFIGSTYINDVTANRGFGFIDQNGNQRYFAITFDMSGLSEEPLRAIEISVPNEQINSDVLQFKNDRCEVVLDASDVISAVPSYYYPDNSENLEICVQLTLTEEGAIKFAEATKEAAKNGTPIDIYANGELLSSPTIDSEYAETGIVGGEAIISGNFIDFEQAQQFSDHINSAAAGK